MSNGLFRIPQPVNEPVRSYAPANPETQALKSELAKQSRQSVNVPLVIGGKRIFSTETDPIHCPHDKTLKLGSSQRATTGDVQAAIRAALEARQIWGVLPWQERAAVFLKAADLLANRYRERILAATMLGQSKTCFQAEIDAACELIDFLRFNAYYAQKIYEEQPMYSPAGIWNRVEARPLEGFVFAVAPFNFTAISLNLACAPALMGCTVVWKPAPGATLASYLGLEVLEEAGLPPGVINMVTGDPALIGREVLGDRHLAGVHFTGSTQTFEYLWRSIGENISNYRSYPRIVGETGGKDFVFAHPSASTTQLVAGLVRGAFEYQGQKCSAASRAYIPSSLWPKVKEKLVAATQSIKMGDPSDFSNFMGAVIDARAFQKITGFIEEAKKSSECEILCGGEYEQTRGNFIRPTVILTKNPQSKTMREEIFGPVLTLYVYPDEKLEETLTICDGTSPYALTGAIYAQDRLAIHHLSERLCNAAGNFYINDKPTGAVVGQQPFGGARKSGTNDKAGSSFNLLRWVSQRTIKENFVAIEDFRYPHMQER